MGQWIWPRHLFSAGIQILIEHPPNETLGVSNEQTKVGPKTLSSLPRHPNLTASVLGWLQFAAATWKGSLYT